MQAIAVAVSSPDASRTVDIVIATIAIVVGGALVLDVNRISTALRRNSTGFTPAGRPGGWRGPNPVRVVGGAFLIVGVITLLVGLVRR